MKCVHFPTDEKALAAVIPPSICHLHYSAKRDFSETWYEPDDYVSFRIESQKLAKVARGWKLSKLLDGTTQLQVEHEFDRSSASSPSKGRKEFVRNLAKLKIWSMYSTAGRGLEKLIHRTHGVTRHEQIRFHRAAVLCHQDRLLFDSQGQRHLLPDGCCLVPNDLATTSLVLSAASSQLAQNLGIADAFAVLTEPDPRYTSVIRRHHGYSENGHSKSLKDRINGQEQDYSSPGKVSSNTPKWSDTPCLFNRTTNNKKNTKSRKKIRPTTHRQSVLPNDSSQRRTLSNAAA